MEESRQHMAKLGRSPLGGRGLKPLDNDVVQEYIQSLPTRGAWIETIKLYKPVKFRVVAPHSGGVD